MVSRQETARQLLTPGEVMQLLAEEELVLVAGMAPIRAKKLRYYSDPNFADRVGSPPLLSGKAYSDIPPFRQDDWSAVAEPGGKMVATAEPGQASDRKSVV